MTRLRQTASRRRFLAYDVIAIFDQVQDQVEHLWLDAYNVSRTPQLTALDVHDAITKQQAHRRHSDGNRRVGSKLAIFWMEK